MIVTFYSFKGGVGRSMALANLGRWFQLRGLDVVLVDWDLEAPGLESYFVTDAAERDVVQGRLGLLDLIATYKDLFPGLPHLAAGSTPLGAAAFAELLHETLPPLAPLLIPLPPPPAPASDQDRGAPLGRLRLLTAGCRSEARFADYAEAVQKFDWAGFYAGFRGSAYFEWLRGQLVSGAGADVVLIDSRTGVAEMSGVCTRQLADVVVTFCGPNDQNLNGVAMMAESFVRPDVIAARAGRPLELVMVPARIDVSEGRPVDLFEANFRARLDRFLPDVFRRTGTSFTRLRIPYISAYSFVERLAVGEPEGVKSLQEAYGVIATHLALLAPGTGALRRLCRADLQAAFGMPSVSVGVLDDVPAGTGPALRARLEQSGVFTVALADGSPQAWLTLPATVLLVAGEESLHDGRIRALWRMARENGVCLFVVTAGTQLEADTALPRWPRSLRLWNSEGDWDELVVQLQRPCQAARVPFLAPPLPARLVGRSEEYGVLRDMLLMPEAGVVTLAGMGGMGKTTLANALCHDDAVVDAFTDGVLWLALGAPADLRAGLVKLVRAFEPGETDATLDLDEARRRLTYLLSARRCLVVYDDVVDSEQIELLPRGGNACQVLLVTRFAALAASVASGRQLLLGPLANDAAREVLDAELTVSAKDEPTLVTLAQRLGNSPLALTVANKALRSRAAPRGRPNTVVADLLRDLDRSGLAAVDLPSGGAAGGSLFATLSAALEQLDSADRARLPLMAALKAQRWISLAELAATLDCSVDEAAQTARRLAAASMVEIDHGGEALLVPPLMHEFLRSLEIQQQRVETTRIVSRRTVGATSVYISYRRSDAIDQASRLYAHLAAELGADRVFMDTASIEIGSSFVEVIANNLERASAVIVLIGPDWLNARDGDGRRRLDDPGDFIRLEVGKALQTGKLVVPLLVRNATMPRASDLPPDLASLSYRNGLELSHATFSSDVDRLVEALTRHAPLPVPTHSSSDPFTAASPATLDEIATGGRTMSAPKASRTGRIAIAVALVIAVGVGFWTLRPGTHSSNITQPAPGSAEFVQAEDLYYARKDIAAALALYRQAAEMGNPSAQNSLGRLYENGAGVERDEAKALAWYRKAAAQGHPDALAALKRLQPAVSVPAK